MYDKVLRLISSANLCLVGDNQPVPTNHLKGSTQRCKSKTACCTVAYLYTYDSLGRLIHSEQVENGNTVLRASQRYNENNQLTGQSWQLAIFQKSTGNLVVITDYFI